MEKEFKEISVKFDKVFSTLKKHDKQFKDSKQEALEGQEELNEKILINTKKLK